MAERPRGRYKRYLEDGDAQVPRQTLARWRLSSRCEGGDNEGTSGDELETMDADDEQVGYIEVEHYVSEAEEDDAEDAPELPSDDDIEDADNDGVEQRHREDVLGVDGDDDGDPLYPGAVLTKSQSASLIMAFALRHSIPKTAVSDLLRLINIHLPEGTVPHSMYFFDKYFEACKANVQFHVYCEECSTYLGLDKELHCAVCEKDFLRSDLIKNDAFFVYIPMKDQVKEIMETPHLSHYFLDVLNEVNVTWNCDGLPAFKSGKHSVWPIQCSLDSLPANLKKEHILITGLWCGSSKPHFQTFLKPFVEECKDLASAGIQWCNPHNGDEITSRIYARTCACDSVARCQLQGIRQFNGYFGCAWCLQEGKRVAKGRGYATVYTFQHPPAPARTHQIVKNEAIKLVAGQDPQYGVKSASPLLLLPQFDIVKGFPVDYMHAVCEGVTEQLTNLWFDGSNHAHKG